MFLLDAIKRTGRKTTRTIHEPEIRTGMVTPWGLKLTVMPSLETEPEVKFAAFDDPRITDPEHYDKFSRYLPRELSILGPPKKAQNCFGYCLDIERVMDRWEIYRFLDDMGFESGLMKADELKEGDIVVYYGIDPDITGATHAGKYVGNGRVRSRWGLNVKTGFGGPVIEHPIKEILPGWYHSIFGVCWNSFRKKN